MIGLTSVSFKPPENYVHDPAWCTKQLDMLFSLVKQSASIARDKARGRLGRQRLKPGMLGAQWHRPLLTHMAQSLTHGSPKHPRSSAFCASISQWQDSGDEMLRKGRSDEELWSWLSGEIVRVFMDKEPEELSTDLQYLTVKAGTRIRDAAVELQQRVNTAVSASLRHPSNAAFDTMRKRAVVAFMQRQFPDCGLISTLQDMYESSDSTSQTMCKYVVEKVRDQNLTAKEPADKLKYPVTAGTAGTAGVSNGSAEEHRRKEREKRKQGELYTLQLEEQMCAMSSADGSRPTCYNCGSSDHTRWLLCSEPYNAERWKAALQQHDSVHFRRIAPKNAKTFDAARNRFKHSTKNK